MTGSFEVKSVEETWAIARAFAHDLQAGDVVCLEGDLGAGKTTFTQALVAELGGTGRVTSPTFCLVQEHPSGTKRGIDVVHMDLYRLTNEQDVLTLGWEDYRDQKCILVVEWPERAGSLIPENAYRVRLNYILSECDEARRIDIQSQILI